MYIALGKRCVEHQEPTQIKGPWTIYSVPVQREEGFLQGKPPYARVCGIDERGNIKSIEIENPQELRKITKWVRERLLLNSEGRSEPRAIVPESVVRNYLGSLDSRVIERHYAEKHAQTRPVTNTQESECSGLHERL